MDGLLLHKHTREQLVAMVTEAPHALLITGAHGMGKRTLTERLASQLTDPSMVTVVEPDEKGTISIDTVRTLYQRTRAKQQAHQVVIIDHAEAMGIEAQNALLKLLEEPRAGVTFLLTAPSTDALLPTITSRLQAVNLPRLGQAELQAHATKLQPGLSAQELAQLLFMADGRPGLLVALLADPDAMAHHKQIMQQAKQMLTATAYERLSKVAELAKNKEDAVSLLEAMARMLQVQLLREPAEQLAQLADDIQVCLGRLAQNGNPRAQLTALFAGH